MSGTSTKLPPSLSPSPSLSHTRTHARALSGLQAAAVAASPAAAPGKVTGRRRHFGTRPRMLQPARARRACLLRADASWTRARAPGCPAGEPVQVLGARHPVRAGGRGPRCHPLPLYSSPAGFPQTLSRCSPLLGGNSSARRVYDYFGWK